MTLEELLAALQALIDNAAAQGRDLTQDEAKRADQLNDQITRAKHSRDALTRSRGLIAPVVPNLPRHAVREDVDAHTRAFDAMLRTGILNPEMAQYRAMGEATGAGGGFLVPDGFRKKIIERQKAFGGIASGAELLETASGAPMPYPTNDDTANSGEIVAERATFAAGADLVIGSKVLNAYKFGSGGAGNAPLKLSLELLQDSAFDAAAYVAKKLGERIARKQASSWAVGSGVNEPVGLLSTAGGLSAAAAIANNTTGPTYAELVTIAHSVDPAYRANGVWVFNDNVLGKLRKLVDAQQRPLLWSDSQSLSAEAGGMTLLGYKVIIDQACPDPASGNNFGFFGSLKDAYVIRRVRDITMVTMNEMYAATGQVGFLAWARADGMVQDTSAGVLMRAA